VRIAVVGDFDPERPYHRATTESLHHAADALGVALAVEWVPTPVPSTEEGRTRLAGYAGVFLAPGAPYRSTDGALAAIRFAREQGWPFFGT
jgi:CTP synthase (UTP-ammonia lyase)